MSIQPTGLRLSRCKRISFLAATLEASLRPFLLLSGLLQTGVVAFSNLDALNCGAVHAGIGVALKVHRARLLSPPAIPPQCVHWERSRLWPPFAGTLTRVTEAYAKQRLAAGTIARTRTTWCQPGGIRK
jgi:hypothetical protein